MRWFFIWIVFLPLSVFAQSDLVKIDAEKGCDCGDVDVSNLHLVEEVVNSGQVCDILAACYFHCIGLQYYLNGEHLKAIQNHESAIESRKEFQPEFVWKSNYMLAMSYMKLNNFQKSKTHFLAAHHDKNAHKRNIDSINIPRKLAESVVELGELNQAEDFALESTRVKDGTVREIHPYNTLALILGKEEQSNGNKEQAIEYADRAYNLYEKAKKKKMSAQALNNKAIALSNLGRYEEAIKNYKLALNIYPDDSEPYAETLNNLGSDHGKNGEYKKGIDALQKSLKIKRENHENAETAYTYAANYENLGEIYDQMGNYKEAIGYFQLAIDNLKDTSNPETPYIYNKPDLIRVLDLQAQSHKKSGNIKIAFQLYQEIANWTDEFYKDLSTNASKLTWINRAHTIYGHAIEVALMNDKPEKAFEYAEKAHAVLLWQSLSQQAAQYLLSDKDRQRIDDIDTEISYASQKEMKDNLRTIKLLNLREQRRNLEKELERDYPDYADSKYQPEATTVDNVQAKIVDNQTAFIEYYRTDEVLYIFTITKKGLEVNQINAVGLADDISNFVTNIKYGDTIKIEDYHTLAYGLYEKLIPSNIHLKDNINHLVIIPDREIGMLPFAALVTQATSGGFNRDTPFLVKKYATNYLYSAGSYLQLQQKEADQRYCFAGIAPVEYQIKGWKNLPNAESELEEIKSLHWTWQREILLKENASKTEFKRIIKEGYRTILVSTHAEFDGSNGSIVFYDDVLDQNEIDQLEIKTHRLVLSACKTGEGKQNQGEGILSLGWNFAYKGVPSITMTHWKIDDYSSKKIMISYHRNLNDEMSADYALKEAQLAYLNNDAFDSSDFSPYYWAAFFHTGNTK